MNNSKTGHGTSRLLSNTLHPLVLHAWTSADVKDVVTVAHVLNNSHRIQHYVTSEKGKDSEEGV
jgi:hypothetical protein